MAMTETQVLDKDQQDMRDDRPTVAVDVDGVLAEYDGRFDITRIGDPTDEGRSLLEQLRDAGYRVVPWSTRSATQVTRWALQHKLPFDHATSQKPIAIAYIDDRAVPYQGNAFAAMCYVQDLARQGPWWQQEQRRKSTLMPLSERSALTPELMMAQQIADSLKDIKLEDIGGE